MFLFGERSEANLTQLWPGGVKIARRALANSTVDFSVFETLRSLERQRKLVASGASRTMNSRHLPNAEGLADAMDLVPYVDGNLQWQMPLCIQVAIAVREAARHFKVELVWGAVWDTPLNDLEPTKLESEIRAYTLRWRRQHPGTKGSPLIDAPHFQRVR